VAVLDALTVHPCGFSTAAYEANAAFVGISMCITDDGVEDAAPDMCVIGEDIAGEAPAICIGGEDSEDEHPATATAPEARMAVAAAIATTR
jgi:hypothetical protein